MKDSTQVFNPYLPSWEYIPDGEPHVFDGRVYVYGSHDRFNGHAYCLNDYVCWSAPAANLKDWRYEGVIYKKTTDPLNTDGSMCLYAPDVTRGPDGRYYLYYVLDKVHVVSVAVCDRPAGEYAFLGYVHHPDGTLLGEGPGDEPQFDPGVLTEGNRIYLYTGFCWPDDAARHGAMVTVLGPDMLTVIEKPKTVVPGRQYSNGSGFETHAFFEASSIRKIGDLYCFIYSSVVFHELCYATSKSPTEGFKYRGVIVSNNDLHIDTYKPARMPAYYGGNNHGSIVEINGEWFVFYHRHTNGTNFSRQGCAEKIIVGKDGSITQAEMTSCGLNGGPLRGKGEYPAYIACNLFCRDQNMYTASGAWMDNRYPKITQDGRDGDGEPGYIGNMMDSATAGFKYFVCAGIRKITIRVRGYCKGAFEVKTAWDGPVLGTIPVDFTNVWTEYSHDIAVPDGIQALYFRYTGQGNASLASFTLE
ncbi:MAG: family 43 glycosylhydrolase [Spirochaetales bacterium]|nr:family 43 glycosylhydrolase [Spirochaetales bacterium]